MPPSKGAAEHHDQDNESNVGSYFHAKNIIPFAKTESFVTKKFNSPDSFKIPPQGDQPALLVEG